MSDEFFPGDLVGLRVVGSKKNKFDLDTGVGLVICTLGRDWFTNVRVLWSGPCRRSSRVESLGVSQLKKL